MAMDAQLAYGEIVGHQVTSYDYYEPLPHFNQQVFLLGEPIRQRAMLFAFVMNFLNTNATYAQIWRNQSLYEPNSVSREYRLVFQTQLIVPTSDQIGRRALVQLSGSCFEVLPGDRVGFVTFRNPGPIGYLFSKYVLALNYDYGRTDSRIQPQINDVIDFIDQLPLPYDFALAPVVDSDMLYYEQNANRCRNLPIPPEPTTTPAPTTSSQYIPGPPGPQGPPGVEGPIGPVGIRGNIGSQGAKGDRGLKGDLGSGFTGEDGRIGLLGPKGNDGAQGNKGAPGIPGRDSTNNVNTGELAAAQGTSDDNCECGEGLLHPNVILGLIIWLLILTLLVIMLIILLTWKRRDETRRDSFRHLQREGPWSDAGKGDDVWNASGSHIGNT